MSPSSDLCSGMKMKEALHHLFTIIITETIMRKKLFASPKMKCPTASKVKNGKYRIVKIITGKMYKHC